MDRTHDETDSSNPHPNSNPHRAAGPSLNADVHTIRHLVRLMHRYELTAIDVIEGPVQIRLRRHNPNAAAPVALPMAAPLMMAPPALAQPPSGEYAAAAPPATGAPPPPPAKTNTVVIESPMVGTFYTSPSPDSPSFVNVGSSVRESTTIGVIEAMKVFTDIPAGVNGTIVEILAKNAQPVEFGQPLFRVEPS
jgi:acetyl-CoA carboxylase biotin carboxyl carrier protein